MNEREPEGQRDEPKSSAFDEARHEIRMEMRDRFFATDDLYGVAKNREIGLSGVDEIVFDTIDFMRERGFLVEERIAPAEIEDEELRLLDDDEEGAKLIISKLRAMAEKNPELVADLLGRLDDEVLSSDPTLRESLRQLRDGLTRPIDADQEISAVENVHRWIVLPVQLERKLRQYAADHDKDYLDVIAELMADQLTKLGYLTAPEDVLESDQTRGGSEHQIWDHRAEAALKAAEERRQEIHDEIRRLHAEGKSPQEAHKHLVDELGVSSLDAFRYIRDYRGSEANEDGLVSELAYAQEDSDVIRTALNSPNLSEEAKQRFRENAARRQQRLEEAGEHQAAACYEGLGEE